MQNDIILIDNAKVIVDEHDLAETINNYYILIVEKSSGKNLLNPFMTEAGII